MYLFETFLKSSIDRTSNELQLNRQLPRTLRACTDELLQHELYQFPNAFSKWRITKNRLCTGRVTLKRKVTLYKLLKMLQKVT